MSWFASPLWTGIVKALLHTLWQGGIIAAVLGLALRRTRNPVLRYRWLLGGLMGMLLAGLVTWAVLNRPEPLNEVADPGAPSSAAAGTAATSPFVVANHPPAAPAVRSHELPWTAWLASVWLAGAILMLARSGIQLAGAGRLRRAARPLTEPAILELLATLRRSLGLSRRVQILVMDRLGSPAVVGVLVPALIVPLSLVTTLSLEQLRFVLLHELAHIRRGDYLANIFQLFAEALLFFNPAAWWLSRQMRIEREACCDLLAIELSGSPAAYARTLVQVAENFLEPGPAALPAFSTGREPSTLAERVRRLLVPGYRPRFKLSWRGMLASFLTGGSLLFLSALGTRLTVAAILPPQQRIAEIEAKMAEYGEGAGTPPFPGSGTNAPEVRISGHMRTAEGEPPPKWVYLNVNSSVPRSSYGTMFVVEDGAFSNSIRSGSIYLGVDLTNYAPAFIGPLDGMRTNRFENLELVLDRGFAVPLNLVDADSGKPVSDAAVATMFWINNNGQQSHSWKSDANGLVTLTHCADLPLEVSANAPGYEIIKKRFEHVRAGEPLKIELKRGSLWSGIISDRETGKPLAGAEFHLLAQGRSAEVERYSWDDRLSVLGTSDAGGVFALNQLRPGFVYSLGVSAAGHESLILENVTAGKSGIQVALGPELIVRGRVTGNLDRLQRNNGEVCLYRAYSEIIAGQSEGRGEWLPLRIANGQATFQFTNRMAGPVTLSGTGYEEKREVTAPIKDWLVMLDAPKPVAAKAVPTRMVVFRFAHPSGVPPRGTVAVSVPDNLDKAHLTAHDVELEITNGEVRVEMPIGGQSSVEPRRLPGYWFDRWQKAADGTIATLIVTNGAGAQVIEVPLISAGAIFARARNVDGTAAGGLSFGLSELKRAASRNEFSSLEGGSDSFSGDAPRKWVSGPLPLGGTYQIYGWRGNSFCLSPPVKLTEEHPDEEIELQFPKTTALEGLLLDPQGKPLGDAEVRLEFLLEKPGTSPPEKHSFSLKSVFTDQHGKFTVENLTPEFGEYFVNVGAPGMLSELVKLKPGSGLQTVRLKRGHVLAGRVVQAGSGWALPGEIVSAFDPDAKLPMQRAVADAEGRFEFTTLGDIKYTFFFKDGQLDSDKKFRADGRTNLVLAVKLYDWAEVKPKHP